VWPAVALALCCAIAPSALAAGKGKHGSGRSSASVTYEVDFSGSGSFSSTDNESVEAVEQCAVASDAVVEHSTFFWDTAYSLTVPKKGELIAHSVKGTAFKPKEDSSWTQTSTVTPAGCLAATRAAARRCIPIRPATRPTPETPASRISRSRSPAEHWPT
jgi:hypothetical protein